MTQLSDHFTLEEAAFSSTAVRNGIANVPDTTQLANMKVAAKSMDQVRDYLELPIHVDSWLRVATLNGSVGGATHSDHMDGWAIDFICPAFGTPLQICQALLKSGIKWHRLIFEGNWCHISFNPLMKQQVETATFDTKGVATYTVGLPS